jgi:hypothetical protein
MIRLATQARNRLHAVLHRHHILPPDGNLFAPDSQAWWLSLDISVLVPGADSPMRSFAPEAKQPAIADLMVSPQRL